MLEVNLLNPSGEYDPALLLEEKLSQYRYLGNTV